MTSLRRLLRWAHIVGGIWIGVFVFSPLRLDDTATLVARLTLVVLGLSGILMWQWPRLVKRLTRGADGVLKPREDAGRGRAP